MHKARVNICLPREQWQRIKERARQKRVSASEYLSAAADQMMGAEEQKAQERLAAWEAIRHLDLGPMPDPDTLCQELGEAHLPCMGEEA